MEGGCQAVYWNSGLCLGDVQMLGEAQGHTVFSRSEISEQLQMAQFHPRQLAVCWRESQASPI